MLPKDVLAANQASKRDARVPEHSVPTAHLAPTPNGSKRRWLAFEKGSIFQICATFDSMTWDFLQLTSFSGVQHDLLKLSTVGPRAVAP